MPPSDSSNIRALVCSAAAEEETRWAEARQRLEVARAAALAEVQARFALQFGVLDAEHEVLQQIAETADTEAAQVEAPAPSPGPLEALLAVAAQQLEQPSEAAAMETAAPTAAVESITPASAGQKRNSIGSGPVRLILRPKSILLARVPL
eukprot:COSAG04_NODE_2330_length_4324_cov_2.131124_4_plen_150_part_00